MRARWGSWVLLAGVAAIASSEAHADEVTLRDGRVLIGRVAEDGDRLVISTSFGETWFDRAEVLRVEHGATLDERYEALRAQVGRDDAAGLDDLAAWCREQGLVGRARRLEAEAEQVRARLLAAERALVLQMRRARAGADAVAIYELARWAELEGYPGADVDRLLREALQVDPALQDARAALDRRAREAEYARQLAEWEAARRAEREREREREEERLRAQWTEPSDESVRVVEAMLARAAEREAAAKAARARAAAAKPPRRQARQVADDCEPAPWRHDRRWRDHDRRDRGRDHDRERTRQPEPTRRPDTIYADGPARAARGGAALGRQLVSGR